MGLGFRVGFRVQGLRPKPEPYVASHDRALFGVPCNLMLGQRILHDFECSMIPDPTKMAALVQDEDDAPSRGSM